MREYACKASRGIIRDRVIQFFFWVVFIRVKSDIRFHFGAGIMEKCRKYISSDTVKMLIT